jgi:FkbM family methyltransferase
MHDERRRGLRSTQQFDFRVERDLVPSALRVSAGALPPKTGAMRRAQITDLAKAIGWPAALSILGRRALKRNATVTSRAGAHEIMIRPVDSDLFVAAQIFGSLDYDLGHLWQTMRDLARSWAAADEVPVILDIGANVGYSAIYFSAMCPDAIVLAVEADLETFNFMSRNVAAYHNIRPVHGAVWSHEDGVEFSAPTALGSWAGKVDGGSGQTPSFLLSSIISSVPRARPLILKLDVEGAEREICRSSPDAFREVPVIMIEPHDFMLPGSGCLTPLYAVLAGRSMDTLLKGENLLFIESNLRR